MVLPALCPDGNETTENPKGLGWEYQSVAADAGRPSRLFSVALGPARLHFALDRMRYLISILPLLLLTGCDPGYGVYRSARVPFMPPVALVGSVVKETPGVDSVDYRASEGGRPLTVTGIKSPDQVHTFSYRGGTNVNGSLQFVVNYKGRVEYSQSLMTLGRRPPQEWIDATRPVMLQIEGGLEHRCGLTNLSASVQETCLGVRCK